MANIPTGNYINPMGMSMTTYNQEMNPQYQQQASYVMNPEQQTMMVATAP